MPRHGEEDDAGDEPEHVPIALDSLISWRSGASGNWSRLSGAIGVPVFHGLGVPAFYER